MHDEINTKILEKIDKIKDKSVKSFLKEIILMEFGKRDEGRWPFNEEYDKRINTQLKIEK
jgi:hypothetical protein